MRDPLLGKHSSAELLLAPPGSMSGRKGEWVVYEGSRAHDPRFPDGLGPMPGIPDRYIGGFDGREQAEAEAKRLDGEEPWRWHGAVWMEHPEEQKA